MPTHHEPNEQDPNGQRPIFDEDAQRRILERALQLQAIEARLASRVDLERIAGEAGVDPRYVRLAIAELDEPKQSPVVNSPLRLPQEMPLRLPAEEDGPGVGVWALIAVGAIYVALFAGMYNGIQYGPPPVGMLWIGFLVLPIAFGLLAKSYRSALIPTALVSLLTWWILEAKGAIVLVAGHYLVVGLAVALTLAVHWAFRTRCGGLIGRRHLSHRASGVGS